jgi:glycosyltransferase involved in cell wall biosynthesis
MKILLCSRRFPPDVYSGTETVFSRLYHFARSQHEVRLVAGWQNARSMIPAEAVAVQLKGLSRWKQWAHFSTEIFKQSRKWKPDVILSNSIEVPPSSIPTACIVHDLNFGSHKSNTTKKAKRTFYSWRSKDIEKFITVSHATEHQLKQLRINPSKIHVVPNGVDTTVFHPKPKEDNGKINFCYPSRIIPGKGQHIVIDAFARLRSKIKKKATLTIVGASTDAVYLDRLRIQAYGLPVNFATNVADIVPYYQAADVILFPTLMTEGFGFTAVEAMACEKPVVWFEQPAIREATNGIGLAVPKEDTDAFTAAMERLALDKSLREKIGAEGLKYVQEHLQWKDVWKQYEIILRGLHRPRPWV